MTQLIHDTGLNYTIFANELPASEQAKADNAAPAGPPVAKEPGTVKNIKLAAAMLVIGVVLNFFLGPFGFVLAATVFVAFYSQARKEGTETSGIAKAIVTGLGVVAITMIAIPVIFILFCVMVGGTSGWGG